VAKGKEEDSFYWQETRAPFGFSLPDPAVFGPVKPGTPATTTTVRNKKEAGPGTHRGKLVVRKVDSRTGRGLPRAVVELWRESGRKPGLQIAGPDADVRIDSGCATDEQGRCDFDGLLLGAYYVRETVAPAGYQLPGNPVSGPHVLNKANAVTGITVRMTNEEKKVKPKK
jgi:uncharacterized surface anchored protein